jgi:hypothetical protein
MRRLAVGGIRKGRVRGLRRRTLAMVRDIGQLAMVTPGEDREGCGYWHAHVPVAEAFIDSPVTPRSIRRLCIQAMIDAANSLRTAQQQRGTDCRVTAAVDLPRLFDSQLIVFFGEDYFSRFFTRETPDQTWVALPPHRSLGREWSLRIPAGFSEWGFSETLRDEDFERRGEVWFCGDLPSARPTG